MSKKFTYLLGAGASALKIPTVNRFTDALNTLADNLNHAAPKEPQKTTLEEIAKGFKWLGNNSTKFGTVDTYAKILYLRGDKKSYVKLKSLLTIFFIFRQLSDSSTNNWFPKEVDPRYLNFLASILDKPIFPEKLKVLTWNYDFQFELAARELMKDQSLVLGQINKKVKHRSPFIVEYFPTSGDRQFIERYNYNIIHLNGIAGLDSYSQEAISYLHEDSHFSIDRICEIFNEIKSSDATFIKFSWENDSGINLIAEHLEQTETLVIIGYSFPFFNRQVDGELFKSLKNLKTIYYQDDNKKNDGQGLYDQFNLERFNPKTEMNTSNYSFSELIAQGGRLKDKGIQIFKVDDVDKFFVPFDF